MAVARVRKGGSKGVAALPDKGGAETAGEGKSAADARLAVGHVAAWSADLRTLVVNLCLLAIVMVMVPVVGLQFLRDQVIIEAIAVPPALVARGWSGDVVANRLWDGLTEVTAEAGSSKEGVAAIPSNQRVDFQVPDAGISIDSVVYHVRAFFHLYQTRISGEILCGDAACKSDALSLRIRILRDRVQVLQMPSLGQQSESAYFRAAAERVLGVLDPFLAAAVVVQRNPEAGLAQAEQLVRGHDPAAIWALNLIGTTRRDLGEIDAAIAAFEAALQIDPGFAIAQTNLGSALVEKGEYARAAQVLDAAARLHPGNRFVALGRYRLALAQGQTDVAIAEVLKAEAGDPGKAMYLNMAGQAAFGAGDLTAAEGYLQRALQVTPDDPSAVALLGALYQMEDDPAKAQAVLRRALAVAPQNVDFLTMEARLLGQMKQFDTALVQVDRALALTPGDAATQRLRASTLQGLGRHDEALTQLDALRPAEGLEEEAEVALLRGQSLQALGRKAEAAAAYRAALAADPNGPHGMAATAYLPMVVK